MDFSKITEIVLCTEGSFVDKIEFFEGKKLVDFKEVGKAISYSEYSRILQLWEKKTRKDT